MLRRQANLTAFKTEASGTLKQQHILIAWHISLDAFAFLPKNV